MASGDVEFGVKAFSKMLLHCLKYPHSAVNGVLLADDHRKSGDTLLHIVDSIPLFHQCLGLTPMLEVALVQIEQHCKNAGLVIAGYYQANEHLRDNTPDITAHRIADKIADNYADACLVMLDNQRLSVDCDQKDGLVMVFGCHDNRWRERGFRLVEKTLSVTSSLLRAKSYRKLTDFDNHLDDITRDWSNKGVNDDIARCL
ncbi:ER membrane protein complex subunit 8-like [Ornithodoros turicata]|uniref:Putative cox4 neighbor n=1 Tax=Ornithodoros turicata TaxID=34597 RepID=A0A2R5LHB9_9ACAR